MSMAAEGGGNGLVVTDAGLPEPASPVQTIARAAANSPLGKLLRTPSQFDFFQAIRLISQSASRPSAEAQRAVTQPPALLERLVRFRAKAGHGFPSSAIEALEISDSDTSGDGGRGVAEMTVTFMGLAGVGGVLPAHYTQTLLDRLREKDFSFRDFLDMFNDRLVWQFWHAWEKNRFYIGFERARREHPVSEDLFTMALYSLVGMGTRGLRNRQAVPDDALLYYSGHFAHFPRSAIALGQLIGDYMQVPVEIRQFQEQWMYLQSSDWTRLGSASPGSPANNRLGVTAIAGERIRDMENKFRVRLGVLDYGTFCRYLPGQPGFVALGQLTRSYAGPSLDFDVQLVLSRDAVPYCELALTGGAQLGWNTWLFNKAMNRDPDDAVFACEGAPVGR